MALTWSQALAWRLERQFLEPRGEASVEEVVRRLGAVATKQEGAAELTLRSRRASTGPRDALDAFEAGEIIRAFAFRGGVHYLSATDGGAYLALRAAGRQWELPSWQEYYRLTPDDWPAFRAAVREALSDRPLTIRELGAALAREPAYRHLVPVFEEGAGTLMKPLTWLGDMCFAPSTDGTARFRRLDTNPHWAGVWDLDEAGPYAIAAYLRAYGPATADRVHYWLGNGLSAGRRRLDRWLGGMSGELSTVEVEGRQALVLAEDLDGLMAARPTDAVHLLPGHDPWVMGAGTKDEAVVPPGLRTEVTGGRNPALVGGVVRGIWADRKGDVEVTWLADPPPARLVDDARARLEAARG